MTNKKQAETLVNRLRERFTDEEIASAIIGLLKKMEENENKNK
jgi:hypothetical protein